MKGTRTRGTEVPVPHLAESVVAATVGKWLKQPGDYIAQYDVICELLTEKVNVEMPSPVEGTLLEILVGEGETAEVGMPICVIEEPGQKDGEFEYADGQSWEGDSERIRGEEETAMRHRYSPAVQSLASEHGIDLREVNGTGLGGRITRKDILKYIQEGKPRSQTAAPNAAAITTAKAPAVAPAAELSTASAAAPSTEPAATPIAATPAVDAPKVPVRTSGLHLSDSPRIPRIEVEDGEGRGEYFIDVTPIRNTIASKMRQSVTEIPHAWTMIEVDVSNLVQLRSKLKDEFVRQEGINLTYLPFLFKAVVNAIKDYPIMNSVWAVDKIIVKRDINISLAVGTEDFVLTPVIKKADQMNIAGLALEIDNLSKKARAGKLSLNDMQGGTFTVNNTGSFGSILSYPIINYPQAAILTFESIVKKPVVIQDMIAVRSMVNLCLSLDHRILDGVICGRFLQRVKENLEGYGPDTKLY